LTPTRSHRGLLARIDLTGALAGVALAVVWGLATDVVGGATAAVGAGVGLINFAVLRRLVSRVFDPITGDIHGSLTGLLAAKFAILAGSLGLFFGVFGLDPLGFAVGMSAVVIAMFFEALRFPSERRVAARARNGAETMDGASTASMG
jgi:hypothetical protein